MAPEQSRIRVFNSGTSKGLKTSIPLGGHTVPISTAGVKLEAKNAQKKAKKNITSEAIKSSIPYLRPNCTMFVCLPSSVPSRITSRHQTNMQSKTAIIPKAMVSIPPI